MVTFLASLATALMLTAIFAFRFESCRSPRILIGLFAVVWLADWCGQYFFLPPDALGMPVVWVCLAVTLLFVVAIVIAERHGESVEPERE